MKFHATLFLSLAACTAITIALPVAAPDPAPPLANSAIVARSEEVEAKRSNDESVDFSKRGAKMVAVRTPDKVN